MQNKDFSKFRTNMVASQLAPNSSPETAIKNAMLNIPRELYVPSNYSHAAYTDKNFPVGSDRFLVTPSDFIKLAELANIKPTDKVLDIACATGYTSAVFSKIADKVYSIENIADLASIAQQNARYLNLKNLIVVTSDIKYGLRESMPYDVIFINGAVKHIPDSLFHQLAECGRVIAILYQNSINNISHTVLGEATLFIKINDNIIKKSFFTVNAYPLKEFNVE